MHAPLDPWKSKLVIPWGLKMTAGGAGEAHAFGMAGLWTASTLNGPSSVANFDGGNGNRTGWGSGASIDQIIARAHGSGMPYERAPDDPVQETPYRTVELGVQCLNPNSLNRMIYAGENSPIHPETSPRAAFNRLFAGATSTGGAPTTCTRGSDTQAITTRCPTTGRIDAGSSRRSTPGTRSRSRTCSGGSTPCARATARCSTTRSSWWVGSSAARRTAWSVFLS
ncbi:DUF1552 domain-containing protein [Sorangium sp. Soce836]|uniref:DUF1552 domain-containing protein n=1 Tax=Sorangium TaxID=39643 RepID=UPI0038B5BE9C